MQEVAQKLIQSSTLTDDEGNPINPLDAHFRSLDLSVMEPVQKDSNEFGALAAYVRNTHGVTHSHYKATVLNAFRVER
jgi:poly [ADP-ribose] polymerase 2/3/4